MKNKSLIFGIIASIVIVIIILIGVIINYNETHKNDDEYDVSMMNEVSVSDILEMFDSKKTYVLYVGRKSCSVCIHMLKDLQDAQKQNNYITQYLDIEKVEFNSEEWQKLISKLTLQSSQSVKEDGSGEKVTETYGYFLDNYGFTPTIIVIKDGKQEAGHIGKFNDTDFNTWIKEKIG